MKKYLVIFCLILTGALQSCQPDDPIDPEPSPSDLTDTTMMNIAYGSDPKQKMDVYLPAGRTEATKVIVLIHGGAWIGGDKNDMSFIAPLVEEKWPEAAVININYRLANGGSIVHNDISNDLRSAINYIADHKTEWQISDDMGLIGASAGAQLALVYAYRLDEEGYVNAVADIFGPAYFADWEFYNSFNVFLGGNVKEVYKLYTGVYWDEDLYKSLSPYHLVSTSNYEPTIIFHGTADPIVPIYHSQWFRSKLDEMGLVNDYHEYIGETHGLNPTNQADCLEKTITFFKEHL